MNEETLEEILAKPQVKRGLFIVRMAEIDPADDFHQNLLYSLEACPPESSDGDLVTAIRFVAGQAKAEAGRVHVEARNAAKRLLRVEARKHRQEGRVSQAAAERIVEEESDAYWDLKVRAELSEVRAEYLKDLQYALQATLDNYRTTRADERAADQWHSRSGV